MRGMADLDTLKSELLDEVNRAKSLDVLEDVRVKALGKKGRMTGLMKELSSLAPEERKQRGQELNQIKQEVVIKLEERQRELNRKALDDKLVNETLDVSLSIRPESQGTIHPISQVTEEIIAIFARMGFAVAEGPQVEDDYHNFTALNIPEEHPARQMHDTFYMPDRKDGTKMVLRTQTSNVQIRTMKAQKPPIKIIAPGRVYRSDSDQTHTPMFHQVEGLVIDEATHFGHLRGCIYDFCREFFNAPNLKMRFRPSYFPFTEPSAEVDIGCRRNKGELVIGEGDDWMEILGCGMVNPRVLENCGLDPEKYQGFAFGMGIDRLAMLKYGIPDLRTFFDSDLRWLKHYGFLPIDMPGGLTR